jgi:hypothetical protein
MRWCHHANHLGTCIGVCIPNVGLHVPKLCMVMEKGTTISINIYWVLIVCWSCVKQYKTNIFLSLAQNHITHMWIAHVKYLWVYIHVGINHPSSINGCLGSKGLSLSQHVVLITTYIVPRAYVWPSPHITCPMGHISPHNVCHMTWPPP